MEPITFALLCLVIILPLYLLFHKSPERKRVEELINKLPGPNRYPIIGTTQTFIASSREDFHDIFIQRNYQYAPLYRSWNGSLPVAHIMKAEHVEIVLSSSTILQKGPSYKFISQWLGEGLITNSNVNKWFRHRKLLTPTFHFKILDNFTEVMSEKGKCLTELLEKKADGKFFDIYPYITHCSLDIISKTAMGVETNSLYSADSEYVKAIYGITELTVFRIYRPIFHGDFVFNLTSYGRQYKKYLEILHGFTRKVIQERREKMKNEEPALSKEDELLGKKKRLMFLDLLLKTNETNPQLTDEELREEVDTFMFAGHDTTTVTMCWALFSIANHPDVQAKVHQELDEVLHAEDELDPQNISQLQYLERVIKETMRLYPTVPVIARYLTKDIQLDQYTIPASAMLVIHMTNLHRDPAQFPEPDRFDPDRFLPERSTNRHPYAFVPFSAGPRNCLGQKFAMRSMKIMLASILRKYEIKARDTPKNMRFYSEVVLRPQNGMHISLTPRKL